MIIILITIRSCEHYNDHYLLLRVVRDDGFEPPMRESKSRALPLGESRIKDGVRDEN